MRRIALFPAIALFAMAILPIGGCSNNEPFVDNGTPADIEKLIAREKTYDKLLPVKMGGKFGYIDRDGKMVVNPQFDEASRFVQGRALISVGAKYGYIDESGKLAINPQFDRADGFFEGLAAVCSGDCGYDAKEPHKWGYINKQGAMAIQPQFGRVSFFHDGLAAVCVGPCTGYGDSFEGKWGYIDQTGKFVINPQFEEAEFFRGGLARVTLGKGSQKKQGYINDKGAFIWTPSN